MKLFAKKDKFGNSRKTRLFIALMLAYPLLQFAVFWVYINFDTIRLTFSNFNVTTGKYEFWGAERYIKVFKEMILGQNEASRNMFWNSFRAILINAIILPIAVVTAYAFHKKVPGGKFFRVLFYLPSMISLVVLAMLWRYMLEPESGPLAAILNAVKGEEVGWLSLRENHLWTIIYVFCIWAGLGSNVIMMCGSMQRIPAEVVEAATLDGAGFWRELVSITIPMIMPTISVFALTGLMACTTFVMQPMFLALTGGPQNSYMTVGWYIFEAAQGTEESILQSATVGIVFSTVTMPIIILAKRLLDKLTPDVSY